jgi:hypothetical protein
MDLTRAEKAKIEGRCQGCRKRNDRPKKVLCIVCSNERRAYMVARRRRLKAELFEAYGGAVCACCGEKEFSFLTLDHFTVKTSDFEHKKGEALYRELKLLGYPPGFVIMCWNCNCGRALNSGTCPHSSR